MGDGVSGLGNTIQEKDHGGVEQNLRYQGHTSTGKQGCITICTGTMIRMWAVHSYGSDRAERRVKLIPIAPNPLSWIDPLGLFGCGPKANNTFFMVMVLVVVVICGLVTR